jgi:predicted O-methyltransferase YrrM
MNDKIEEYILSHIEPEPEHLTNLIRTANVQMVNPRMNSGHLQGRFLKMLVSMIRPKRVLELGAFAGYSALCMAEGLDDDAKLITVEIDDEKEDFIHARLAETPHGKKVELRIGDALATLDILRQEFGDLSFDMIFMDADKRTYPECYDKALPLLRHGGFLIADNTLWDGHVIDPAYKDRQTMGIRRFNDKAATDPQVETVIIPLRDGISLIRKK